MAANSWATVKWKHALSSAPVLFSFEKRTVIALKFDVRPEATADVRLDG